MAHTLCKLTLATAAAHEFFDRYLNVNKDFFKLRNGLGHIMLENSLRMMKGQYLKPFTL